MDMTRHSPDQNAGYMQTLSFMSLVQNEVRDLGDFYKITREHADENVRGARWQRHSICEARWTLEGPNGKIEVHASHANDFGCSLITRVTCTSPALGAQPVNVTFGGDQPQKSSVPEVVRLLSQWLPFITKPAEDPFSKVSMPAA